MPGNVCCNRGFRSLLNGLVKQFHWLLDIGLLAASCVVLRFVADAYYWLRRTRWSGTDAIIVETVYNSIRGQKTCKCMLPIANSHFSRSEADNCRFVCLLWSICSKGFFKAIECSDTSFNLDVNGDDGTCARSAFDAWLPAMHLLESLLDVSHATGR